MHPALRVSDHPEYGLGVSATAADGVIPPGAVLIDLPGRIPLRLRRPADAADAVLMQLADQVPACDRGTVGNETGLEVASREDKIRFVLVAIYREPARDLYRTNLLSRGRHKELAICSSPPPDK